MNLEQPLVSGSVRIRKSQSLQNRTSANSVQSGSDAEQPHPGEAEDLSRQSPPKKDRSTHNPLSDHATAAAAAGDTSAAPTIEEDDSPAGPFVQFLAFNPVTGVWRGSILVVLGCLDADDDPNPGLTVEDQGHRTQPPRRRLEAGIPDWTCWRWDISFTLGEEQRCIPYEVRFAAGSQGEPDRSSRFWLPGRTQAWQWAFHSCNGLSMNADLQRWGAPRLWEDVLRLHASSPLHACVGGGDQIYNDGVWKESTLKEWLAIGNATERYEHPFTAVMRSQAANFYFSHYRAHFSTKVIAHVMACVPQLMIWDDHCLWDGYGSYPTAIQLCPVFQGLYLVARQQYLLWQQHAELADCHKSNDFFGPSEQFSFMRMLGPSTALLCPDTRADRSLHQVLSPAVYDQMFQRLELLPADTRHLVVCMTVPMVWPKLPFSEGVMSAVDGLPVLKKVMSKTGVGAGIVDKFGHAELLDDIVDSWEAAAHKKERIALIQRLQGLAKLRGLRITFLSGDVHCAGVGRLYTRPKVRHLRNDHRFMPQIVSSAIWNAPPPDALMTLMHATNRSHKVCQHTGEKMVRVFHEAYPKSPKLLNRRNWCLVTPVGSQLAPPAWSQEAGSLVFTLRCEDPDNQSAEPQQFHTIVPPLVLGKGGMRPSMSSQSLARRMGLTKAPKVSDPLEEL